MPNADGSKSGGRKKGTPNKTTKSLKEAIMQSFEQVGGAAYLVRLAQDEPKAYSTLLGRVLPAELNAKIEGGLNLTVVSGIDAPPGTHDENS